MEKQQTETWLHRRLFWEVKGWHLLSFIGTYFLFGLIYCLALLFNSNFEWNPAGQTFISYSTKALLSAPIYWLIFVKLKNRPLPNRLLIHLLTMPVYIIISLFVFQVLCDVFGIGYLRGVGIVWDIYIPFLLYFVQFGFLHFYDYFSRAEKHREAEHEMRQLALQSEVNALKAQIQPHFLFNTLNSISASVPPEMERTRELIAQLADTFRFGLQASQTDRVPLREEIHFLRTYLKLVKQRFGERLKVDFQVEEELLDHSVPPMLLQPLVENAVTHGVEPSVHPVTVSIGVKRVGEGLRFSVADTGPGYGGGNVEKMSSENGIGLRNTRLRLEKVFGKKLTVRTNEPRGLIFEYEIPLLQN